MSSSDCLTLRHRNALRCRYKIDSATTICWSQLERELSNRLANHSIQFRCNRLAGSISFHTTAAQGELNWHVATHALVASLDALGVTPPPPKVLAISVKTIRTPLPPIGNAITLGLSLILALMAFLLLLIGLPALLLPLSPGSVLILLATWCLEFSLLMRRPFVQSAP